MSAKPPAARHIVGELGNYTLVSSDGEVLRCGPNPEHLAYWSLATDSDTEVSHDYDLRAWEESPYPRPR